MAIIKHLSSKNARYCDVLEYYTKKHKEDEKTGHYEPILDENGMMQERENYAIGCLDPRGRERDPNKWASACIQTNYRWQKNQDYDDRKIHQYIISHPAEDRAKMTVEDLMEEGKAFARKYLQGYDVLLAVHRDTDNDHIHISINSVRAMEREEQDWMEKGVYGNVLRKETQAGMKHQNGAVMIRDCQQWLLEYTTAHDLKPEDNLKAAEENKAQKFAARYAPLREEILVAAAESKNLSELKQRLLKENNIRLVRRGETFTVFPPGRDNGIRLKTLAISNEELYRTLDHGRYADPKTTPPQMEQEQRQTEEKKYIQWLKLRREKNAQKAEDTIAVSTAIIQDKLHAAGMRYRKEDFQELNILIQKTTYVERDLQTEADKLDALLDRWQQYRDSSLSEQERRRHGNYIRWCGCDPDSPLDLADLINQRELIDLEMTRMASIRESLFQTADKWKGLNDLNNLNWAERNLNWTVERKAQLKGMLESCRASRKKLEQIAYNCQRAAFRRIGSMEMWDKANHFYRLCREKRQKEKELKSQIKAIRKKEREARRQVRKARSDVQNASR